MLSGKTQELKNSSFEGFYTIGSLMKNSCSTIPRQKGVYLVLNHKNEHSFLDENVGGHFKGKNPTLPINKLIDNWVGKSRILYIGKAGGFSSKATLHSRLKQYMRFGNGEPVGHWGGRLIWQIKSNRKLLIAYKMLNGVEPREYEKTLISNFIESYKKLPFANLAH